MGPDDWPEWLPADWTVQIRKIDDRKVKCYVDPEGHKFYSKPQVDRHLKSLNTTTVSERTNNGGGSTVDLSLEPDVPPTNEVAELTPRPRGRPRKSTTGSSINKSKETGSSLAGDGSSSGLGSSQRKNGESEWLPDGWTVEVKIREKGGAKYKIYVDPVSGRKFFSKPQVLSYLGTTNSSGAKQREGDKFSTETDKSQKYEATGGESTDNPKKTESVRMSTAEYELISSTPADGLPPGWVKEIRMRKHGKKDPYYLDPLSGYIFFSKLDALRYLESGDVKKCAMRPLRRDMNEGDIAEGEFASPPDQSKRTETSKVSPNNSAVELKTNDSGTTDKRKVRSITGDGYISTPDASRKSEASDWLPDGWVVEVNVRDNGSKYKCFKESATGRKFYSKPQVLNYLGNVNSSNSRKRKGGRSSSEDRAWSRSSPSDVKRQKGSIKKKGSIVDSNYTEVIETSPAAGLPPGWIKEIRTKKYATHERKDPYYTDPLTGYIFRSKLDAFRFLETGDVNLCAIRPKKKDANGNEVYVFGPDGQKPVKKTPSRKGLFGDEQPNDASTDPTTQILEENDVADPETAANTSASGRARRVTPARTAKHNKPSTPLPARTSGRLKGAKSDTKSSDPLSNASPTEPASRGEDNGVVQEKQVSGVNVEKQADEDQLSYQLDDPNWTDQCLDFAVRTLTSEILTGGDMPVDVNVREENVGLENGMSETPTKVN